MTNSNTQRAAWLNGLIALKRWRTHAWVRYTTVSNEKPSPMKSPMSTSTRTVLRKTTSQIICMRNKATEGLYTDKSTPEREGPQWNEMNPTFLTNLKLNKNSPQDAILRSRMGWREGGSKEIGIHVKLTKSVLEAFHRIRRSKNWRNMPFRLTITTADSTFW